MAVAWADLLLSGQELRLRLAHLEKAGQGCLSGRLRDAAAAITVKCVVRVRLDGQVSAQQREEAAAAQVQLGM